MKFLALRKVYLFTHAKHNALALVGLVVVGTIAILIINTSRQNIKATNVPAAIATSHMSTSKPSNHTSISSKADGSGSNNPSTPGNTSTPTTASADSMATVGPCSSVLTAIQAKSVLGGYATANSGNGTTNQSTDITTTTCAYTYGLSTAKIVDHRANTPTGEHENDDQFGSSRPSGVTSISGYGQVAYWQLSTGLNILLDDNWLIVSVTSNNSLNESNSMQLAKAAQL